MFTKLTKGGHFGTESITVPPPTEFARFDTRRATMDRMKSQIIALRDKAIRKERHINKKS